MGMSGRMYVCNFISGSEMRVKLGCIQFSILHSLTVKVKKKEHDQWLIVGHWLKSSLWLDLWGFLCYSALCVMGITVYCMRDDEAGSLAQSLIIKRCQLQGSFSCPA